MELVVIVSTAVSVFIAVLAVILLLCYKYRKYVSEKKRRDKLYGELYVKLYEEENTKLKKKPFTTQSHTQLCQGMVQTVDYHEQVSIGEEYTIPEDEDVESMGQPSPTRFMSKPPFERSNSRSMQSAGSTVTLTPARSVESLTPSLNKHRNSWRSMSNLLTSKPRPTKRKRSSHSMTSPLSYDSIEEALTSSQGFSKDMKPQFTIGPIEEADPEIILSMLYEKNLHTLSVTIHRISYLYKLVQYDSVYVQGHIRPRNNQKQSTSTVEGDELEIDESFSFDDLKEEDVKASHLMLTVHKASNDKILAELFINLALLDVQSDTASHYKFPLILKKRSRRKSTLDKLLKCDLGELLILLYYQPLSSRLKVVVNKARSLPKTETSPFKPEYQIVIDLYDRLCEQILQTKTTQCQSTENPTWNESLHFDLETTQINDYYLEFTVLEKRRYKPSDAVIGHVVLGPDRTTSHAIKQWTDCLTPSTLELARWHSILPVIRYNIDR